MFDIARLVVRACVVRQKPVSTHEVAVEIALYQAGPRSKISLRPTSLTFRRSMRILITSNNYLGKVPLTYVSQVTQMTPSIG
jgi:hypothetical protein